jgi:hypothetical protein
MKVTDLDYNLENKLVQRLDKFAEMVQRVKQIQDVVFCIHGRTGQGKTNSSLLCGYYLKSITGRELHLFFSTSDAAEFAKVTREKIIIIDEPSLDSLSKDQMTRINKDFFRLLNTMRQKRHIIIVNITRFWRFPFDLVVDRSLGMINMHSRDGRTPGRFQYIRQKDLERLWNDYQRFHRAEFGKLKKFGGWMPERMETINLSTGKPYFDAMGVIINGKQNCTYEDYKNFREMVINKIGVDNKSKKELKTEGELKNLKFNISHLLKKLGVNFEKTAHELGYDARSLQRWANYPNYHSNLAISLENAHFKPSKDDNIVISMGKGEDDSENPLEADVITEK